MSKNRLDYTANLGRHSHDVSGGYTSSLTCGPIVPQYFDILQPGEKIFYKTHMFTRFQDVVTAFLGEIDLHLDYFFVPAQMLYTAFGNIFTQTNDFISSFYQDSNFANPDNFPIADVYDYYTVENNYTNDKTQTSKYCFESFLKGSFRLLDSLDYNALVTLTVPYEHESDPDKIFPHAVPSGFPFALAAYQAIYQKFFRNDEFERLDVGAFNMDIASTYDNLAISELVVRKLLTLRYCGRPNDYFTNIRFSPIATSINSLASSPFAFDVIGDVSGGSVDNFGNLIKKVSNYLNTASQTYTIQQINGRLGVPASTNNQAQGSVGSAFVQDTGLDFINAQNIRAIFALDKYMRVYGRAGKTYDDQILAHFGVKVPHDVKHDLTHLKHYRIVLQSDPVMSTADTETGNVGTVGGQVAAVFDSNEESFVAPVHGVFMCVARVIPHPRYFLTNSRLHSISNRLGLPIAEFDKLGAQLLYNFEYCVDNQETQYVWKNRYSEFKEKYNRVSISYSHSLRDSQGANFFSPWVVSRRPYGDVAYNFSVPTPSFRNMFVQPDELNNIMKTSYNLAWPDDAVAQVSPHVILQTDPILTEFACFAKKVSWMSPTGEPDL